MLQKGVNAAWERNAVIRHNIANVETPNFKASDVEFESIMARALDGRAFRGVRTHPRHIPIGSGNIENVTHRIVQRQNTTMRIDGNNVDVENENVMLAQNSLQHSALIEAMNGEIRRLRMAITEVR
jgi:flagellar basal-body rod protein FlgB